MDNELLILWTTDHPGTSRNMVLMYAENSKLNGWWDEVTLLIWGASAKLISEDTELQKILPKFIDAGVRIIACRQCAKNYDVVEILEGMNIEVFYTGEFLTDWIKQDKKLITI